MGIHRYTHVGLDNTSIIICTLTTQHVGAEMPEHLPFRSKSCGFTKTAAGFTIVTIVQRRLHRSSDRGTYAI